MSLRGANAVSDVPARRSALRHAGVAIPLDLQCHLSPYGIASPLTGLAMTFFFNKVTIFNIQFHDERSEEYTSINS